jgi:hypothetical protein
MASGSPEIWTSPSEAASAGSREDATREQEELAAERGISGREAPSPDAPVDRAEPDRPMERQSVAATHQQLPARHRLTGEWRRDCRTPGRWRKKRARSSPSASHDRRSVRRNRQLSDLSGIELDHTQSEAGCSSIPDRPAALRSVVCVV